jgi:hypothetical protein
VETKESHSEIQIKAQRREYRIEVVDHEYVLNRWQEIEEILYRVFAESKFNGSFARTRPAEHTYKILTEPYQEGIKHVMALDSNNNILGAFFAIPAYRPPGKENCDLGWMFTIELHKRFRHEVMKAIINKVHEVTKAAGFKRIITEMGTEAGANFLSKKYNYVHTPTENQYNRWTKEPI